MNLWYVGHDNEILIDMDKPGTSMPHANKRIAGAIEHHKLDVYKVELHESFTPSHVHALITLNNSLSPIERIAWGIVFHSDIYRGATSLMRVIYSVPSPDLLVTPREFIRPPDYCCECPSKHTEIIMNNCPVAKIARREWRIKTFFSVPESTHHKIFAMPPDNKRNHVWYNLNPFTE
jgi:hypothetical protein